LIGVVVDGKYRVEALLGEGGMGVVYRATQIRLERTVALKVMRGDYARESTRPERFKREALAIARIKHPNAITVYDFGVCPAAGAYFVMELLEGRSLRAALQEKGSFAPAAAVELMAGICDAVDAAHAAGVVHRDLKPANIFLESLPDGAVAVKVLDFGIAKLVATPGQAPKELTVDGAAVGTPLYMSPEQCDGLSVDARSDVYALGCLAYELLAGRPPFRAGSEAALFIKHLTEIPKPPSAFNGTIPRSLDAVVLRAVAKLPGERYQTAAGLALALAAAVHGPATGAEPAPSFRQAPHELSRWQRTTDAGPACNLPRPATSFVGRDREMSEIDRYFEVSRLVTLTGVGGCGKTRLALRYAETRLDGYPGGVWFAELAGVSDDASVAPAIATATGVAPDTPARHVDAVAHALSGRRALLVVDNCEHEQGAARRCG
jgi:serine/threonine protein kinase